MSLNDVRLTVHTLSAHQKTAKGAPAYSRFVNRPLGRYFAAAAYHRGLTPNSVTMISAAVSCAGIAAIALLGPTWPAAFTVTTLLVLGYALDSADGQLARLRGGGNPSGEWLDHVVDCVKISLLHIAVLVAMWRSDIVGDAALVLPLAFLVVAQLYFFAYILGDLLTRASGAQPAPATAKASVLRAVLVAPTDYGLLCLVFITFGAPAVFLPAYAVLLLGTAGYVALGLPKWFRDMQRLPRVAS
jgi:phosphatidylglycerophosphate synthase